MPDPLAFLKYAAQAQQGQQGPGGFDALPEWLLAILRGGPSTGFTPMGPSLAPGGFDPSTINLMPGGFTPKQDMPQERVEPTSPDLMPGMAKAVNTVDVPYNDPNLTPDQLRENLRNNVSSTSTIPINILTGRDLYKYLWDTLPDNQELNDFIENLVHAGYLQAAVEAPNHMIEAGSLAKVFDNWLDNARPPVAHPWNTGDNTGIYGRSLDSTMMSAAPSPYITATEPRSHAGSTVMHELGHAVAIGSNARRYLPLPDLTHFLTNDERLDMGSSSTRSDLPPRNFPVVLHDALVTMVNKLNGYRINELSIGSPDMGIRAMREIPSTLLEAWFSKEHPDETSPMSNYITQTEGSPVLNSGEQVRTVGPPLSQADFDLIDRVKSRVFQQAKEGADAASRTPPWIHPKLR